MNLDFQILLFPFVKTDVLVLQSITFILYIYIYIPGADKSLARPGKKQAQKHVRDAHDFNNIETQAVIKFFFFCKARRQRKFMPF